MKRFMVQALSACLVAFSLSAATGSVGSASAVGQARAAITDPARYVNNFIGTGVQQREDGQFYTYGNTYPGAVAPFGMLAWSPDTIEGRPPGGSYNPAQDQIDGFSLTRMSGAGCEQYLNMPFLPFTGTAVPATARLQRSTESASPGTYAVTTDSGVKTELTATTRSGIGRFTYPDAQTASLSVNAAGGEVVKGGSVQLGANTISGHADAGPFCGINSWTYRVYFHAIFDRPFKTATTVNNGSKAVVSFDTTTNRTVVAKVAVSFVSVDGAKANIAAETASKDFDTVRTDTRAAWNQLLGRISVTGGTADQLAVFYTALYHALLHPNVFSDADGRYRGFDDQIHTAANGHVQHANFSGWDIFRSQVPLLALIAPEYAADIAQSAVNQAAQGGFYDRWTVANRGSGIMVGDPIPVILSTIYAFGVTGFNASDGLTRAVAGTRHSGQRFGFEDYDAIGYVPNEVKPPVLKEWFGSASVTAEYAISDFAISQLAGRLGRASDAERFLRKSSNWRNVFESGSKFLVGRNRDTTYPAFDPLHTIPHYTEGSGHQYTWMVPHNIRGLFDARGGDAAMVGKLDRFFTKLNDQEASEFAYLGNQVSANVPWIYGYAGAPHRTQDVVRRALVQLFRNSPDGLPGNDDLGQMSAWGVWASLGMYPQVPGRSELVLASPRFPSVTIDRGNGKTITINAPGASDSNRYVQSLKVNGQTTQKSWLSEEFVAAGGVLDFVLGASPNTSWGSQPADRPPSFDVGPAQPRTTAITGLSGLCLDVDGGAPDLGASIRLWGCNGTIHQQWTLATDGTLRARGGCMDIRASSRADGAKIQLYACNGTGAQQWWPRPGGALVNPASGKCLDVPGSNTTPGIQLQLYHCNGSAAQSWTIG